MSAAPSFIVRPAESVDEVSKLWWPLMQELGWNRDHDDAHTHYHVARDGKDWLLLVPEETGKPEGCIVAFTYPNSTGWVGFFCVNEAFRGRRWGAALWKGLEASFKASETAIIGLDGVQQQVETYTRRGFVDVGLIKLMLRPSLKEKPLNEQEPSAIGIEEKILDLRSADPKLLAELDQEHTGFDRSALWTQKGLFSRSDIYGYALLSSRSDKLTGSILVRRCEHGYRIGPLYAGTYDQALLLLHTAMSKVAGSDGNFIAEIFGCNPQGRKLFEELGWNWSGIDYHRMWFEGRVPQAQQIGGLGTRGMYATFDAAEG